jgi:hypothetical protein
MVVGIAGRREDRNGLGAIVRAQASAYKVILAPGALLAVLSGVVLTFSVSGRMGELVEFNIWLIIMQGAGVVGALIVLLISLPTAAKLSRLDPLGPGAAYFDELRQRQKIVASVAGTLALVALVAGAWLR